MVRDPDCENLLNGKLHKKISYEESKFTEKVVMSFLVIMPLAIVSNFLSYYFVTKHLDNVKNSYHLKSAR